MRANKRFGRKQRKNYAVSNIKNFEVITNGTYTGSWWKQPVRDTDGEFLGCLNSALVKSL
ncbi:hypothetical protein HYT92_00685 [Candidatus Pacearchaeota archaeon]|nr:hypothetical protein [Candidatus Pacearchaeota archaeon]